MRWRERARKVIWAVIAEHPELRADRTAMLAKIDAAKIDAAYPFGPRSHHPYKAWLAERRKALVSLALEHAWDSPALERPCPACGVASFRMCRDLATRAQLERFHEARLSGPLFGAADAV